MKRPASETGELLEEQVRADHFRPKFPSRPKPRADRRVSPCSLGWTWLHAHDDLCREVEYWEAHATALTREECSEVAHGAAAINRPIPPAWKKGDVLEVASRVWATVRETKWTRKGYRTLLSVRDDRPTFPRHVPGVFSAPELDDAGIPIKHSATEIEAARIDGNYTQDPGQAVPSTGEEVGIDYQNVLRVKSKARDAGRRRKSQPQQEGNEDARRLGSELRELAKRAAKMGVDPLVVFAPIAQEIAEAHAKLGEHKVAA